MREDSFCIFIFMKAVKSLVLKEWAELVASQLTQLSTFFLKIKIKCFEKISGWRIVFT